MNNLNMMFSSVKIYTDKPEELKKDIKEYTKEHRHIYKFLGDAEHTAQILFIHEKKLENVKALLEQYVKEKVLDYFIELKCSNSEHYIFFYDVGDKDKLEEVVKLSDCTLFSGMQYDNQGVLNVLNATMALKFKNIVLDKIPNYLSHEEYLAKEIISHANKYFIVAEDSKQEQTYYYKLIMDNLLLDILKNLHAQGKNQAAHLYVYEKMRKQQS